MVILTSQSGYHISRRSVLVALGATLAAFPLDAGAQIATRADPLPSWNDGTAKRAVLDFVRATTDRSSKEFVAEDDRIATFDQDGTLWVEHPIYVQAEFALDRVHELAPQHPEWRNKEPFRSVLSNDLAALVKFTERDWAEIVFLTHAAMSETEFLGLVRQWLKTATHPRFKRPYTDLVYQLMREVMTYLHGNGFNVFIVTGGGQDFVRAYSERVYGLQPEQIVGSSLVTKYEMKNGKPELMRLPKLFFDDDHAGKVIGINLFIGKRPYASFGNSTGDREMLEWTGAGEGARLKCWCTTTMQRGNMPMDQTLRWAHSTNRRWTKRKPVRGRLSACKTTGSAFFRSSEGQLSLGVTGTPSVL